jgi:formate hydrogenlyase subunit 6/NADH:ubiquinone oxidoreductase subunit I
VRDCPYGILRLAKPGDAAALGTPFFVAREKPCEMCEDIPCIVHCPTEALKPGNLANAGIRKRLSKELAKEQQRRQPDPSRVEKLQEALARAEKTAQEGKAAKAALAAQQANPEADATQAAEWEEQVRAAEAPDIAQARMGLAVLIDHESCLNYLGLRCDVCYRVCPLIEQAITLEGRHNERSDRHAMLLPTVHSDYCTGCGKCEKACVLEEPAIKVLPAGLAQGRLGSHYFKGWEEKQKHGGSLIGKQLELPVRGMEGQPYGALRPDAPPVDAAGAAAMPQGDGGPGGGNP